MRRSMYQGVKKALPYRRVGAISQEFNIDYYPDKLSGKKVEKESLRQVLDNIGAASKKTRARILTVYKAAYKKHPGSKKLGHVIEYIKRMNKAGRKMKRTTRKVVI